MPELCIGLHAKYCSAIYAMATAPLECALKQRESVGGRACDD